MKYSNYTDLIVKGSQLAYEKMLEEKRLKNQKVVVMINDEVVSLTPDELEAYHAKQNSKP